MAQWTRSSRVLSRRDSALWPWSCFRPLRNTRSSTMLKWKALHSSWDWRSTWTQGWFWLQSGRGRMWWRQSQRSLGTPIQQNLRHPLRGLLLSRWQDHHSRWWFSKKNTEREISLCFKPEDLVTTSLVLLTGSMKARAPSSISRWHHLMCPWTQHFIPQTWNRINRILLDQSFFLETYLLIKPLEIKEKERRKEGEKRTERRDSLHYLGMKKQTF